jgi:chemotaxis methyl-accepting protein methylase
MTELPLVDETELKFFCETIGALAGIAMKAGKHDLVRARLRSRLAENNFTTYREYKEFLESLPKDHPEWENFINLLTTNKTDFFREPQHFDYLVHRVLPEFLASREKTLKIWSAASSTGEEAFTLAMVLDRYLPEDRDFKILASDIDTNVLKTGTNAVYSAARKREIPEEYHSTCLDFGKREAKDWFRIKRHLKEKIVFKHHNLIESSSPGENIFDLILCRNVLIYFDKKTIEFVAHKLHHSAKPGGHLFIGHSESLQNVPNDWKMCGPSVFRKDKR